MIRRKTWIAGCTVAVLGLVVWGQAQDDAPPVEVARLTAENWKQFAPEGKEVDAIAGKDLRAIPLRIPLVNGPTDCLL